MKKSLITKIIGVVLALSGIGMSFANVVGWGWVFGFGVLIIIISAEED